MKNSNALLVIDMQKGSFIPETPRYDREGVVQRINELAQLFRTLGFPVIIIQHDGTGTGFFEKNTFDWENLDDLVIQPTDINIDKYANDVFYKSELHATLQKLEINELFITGCATDFCVESTIQSALIDHYNWVWQNMIPTQGKVEVKESVQIKKSLSNKVS